MTFGSTAITVLVAAISASGCVTRTSQIEIVHEPNGVQWTCAAPGNPAEGMANTIVDWARREARDSVHGSAFRADYGLTGQASDIAIVRNSVLCALAGRAYAQRDSLPPFLYH